MEPNKCIGLGTRALDLNVKSPYKRYSYKRRTFSHPQLYNFFGYLMDHFTPASSESKMISYL